MTQETAFTHLTYKPSAGARVDHHVRKILGAVFSRFYPAKLALRMTEKAALAIRNCTINYEPLLAQPKVRGAGGAAANSFGSAFGYEDDKIELDAVMYYRTQLRNPDFENIPSESAVLYKNVVEAFEGLLAADPSIKTAVDFGVSYAYVDSLLAKNHPDLKIIGCDRSQLTMAVNRVDFGNIPNLVLHGGDIFECLDQYKPIDVLFHMRTACLLPAEFLSKLYEKARSQGARYVVLAEQMGLSWETDAGYEFSEGEQKSVLLRWKMLIHNYPSLLKHAGFKVQSSEFFGTNHANPNLKLLLIVASVE